MNKITRPQSLETQKSVYPSLAEIRDKIQADNDISKTRKRDQTSAITRLCQMIGREPFLMTSDLNVVKNAFETVHPAQVGVSRKTLQTLKSNVLSAIRHITGKTSGGSGRQKLSADWQRLMDLLPNRGYRAALSRLARYCSTNGISPDDVRDEIIPSFIKHIHTETFARKPNDIHRRATRAWNFAMKNVPGWPNHILSVPSFRKPRQSFPIEAFPKSLQKDIENHIFWLSGQDFLAEHQPPKPCKPRTIDQRLKTLLLTASTQIHEGVPIEDIRSLSDIVAVDAMKLALNHYWKKTNQTGTAFMHGMAKTAISIARSYVRADDTQIEGLRVLKRRLGKQPVGLTSKNRGTLRQFEDPSNILRLLDLPELIINQKRLKKLSEYRVAVQVQIALAISILLHAPLRMHNLTHLRLDTHIVRPGGKTGPVLIVIPATETKGGQILEYPIEGFTREMLDRYLSQYRPLICDDGAPWLFPSKGGKCKSQKTLSQQIGEAILKHTGLTMTPHQFRHFAAKMGLDNNPGNMMGISQLLGHKSIKSTEHSYTELQTANASRHYDQILEQRREEIAQMPPQRHKRKGPKS